ncbi:MAG: hypothetical protein IKY84_07135 [Bacteroidaceae bacterium]|nr:hypothetical protein [Bacteroidaceae bacterium]
MKSILIAALCAVSFSTQAEVVKRDTIHKYTIDKQAVEHFDGSQLEGKHIAKYIIAYKENGNVVEKHHVIYTGNEDAKIVMITKDNDNLSGVEEPLIIVDKKEMSKDDFAKLPPEEITHIYVLKPESQAAIEVYGEKGKNGVIEVTTKNATTASTHDPLIIVDNKEVTKEEYEKIAPEKIDHIDVLKPESQAAKELYGDKGKNGVIVITTKAAQKKKK